MSWVESWTVDEDVAAHNTVEVAPSYDKPKSDASLVNTLNIVGDPTDRDWNDRVDTQGTQEATSVLNSRVGRSDKHDEACHTDRGSAQVEDASLVESVGIHTDANSNNCGQSVGWYAEKLVLDNGLLVGEGHVLDDGRQENAERVQGHQGSHVDEHAAVGLPVGDGLPEVLHLELFILGRRLLVGSESIDDASSFLFGDKLGIGGEIVDHPERDDTNNDGHETFKDENPCPAGNTGDTIHLLDSSSQETTERTGKSCS